MKILCTLPNASKLISGVKFESTDDGMLSETVSADIADGFAGIPGYEVIGRPPAAAAPVVAPAVASPERLELLAKAEAMGLKVKASWGNDRLKMEVEAAEAAKSE